MAHEPAKMNTDNVDCMKAEFADRIVRLIQATSQQGSERTRNTRMNGTRLCRRCASINLDSLLSTRYKTSSGKQVRRLGRIEKWSIEFCSLCALLAAMLSPSDFIRSDINYTLRSLSSDKMQHTYWSSINTGMIQPYPGTSAYLVPQPEGANFVRILKKDSVDFELLKSWICLCQDMHTKVCGFREPGSIPSLKLIDCNTRAIVPASNHLYVALSYTWGLTSRESSRGFGSLPEHLPPTIEDAVIVTRRLGFQFLWIDRYCINQQSAEEVFEQVQKMDLIYQNAQVTIIAAAGQDPSYGLPGVGYRNRSSQASAKIGKHFLVSSLENPQDLIQSSKWMTRAWTYQEALLSRRRLVFTDQQVYFECYGMYCCETLNFPLQDLHTRNHQGFKKVYCNGENIGLFPKGVGRSAWEVTERIEEYTQKSLSQPSDILKGILGILRAFETGVYRVHHCFAVPVLPARTEGAKSMAGTNKSYEWSTTMGFFSGLCWELKEPSERRLSFPSWSWTGWFGHVSWEFWNYNWKSIRIDPDAKFSIELRDGRVLKWEEFQQSYDELNRETALSQFIHISAWTTPIRVVSHDSLKQEVEARIDLEDKGYLAWHFKPTVDRLLSDHLCIGIHLLYEAPDEPWNKTGPAIMVVSKVGNRMERVGFGWISATNSTIYDSDGLSEFAKGPLFSPFDYAPPRPRFVKSWQEIRLG